MSDDHIIGIDLGTTNSCVAVFDGKDSVVIPNAEGSRTTPSIIGFTENQERVFGQVAKRQSVTNPQNTIYSMKRLMGRPFTSKEAERQKDMCPYNVVKASNGDAWIEAREKTFSPPELSAMVLTEMRSIAETYLGEKVTRAVITVPAYFNDAQRQATKDAGLIAGLKVERIINEPTAAALAYGMEQDSTDVKRLAVYDLGGGTFDISILEMEAGVFSVKSTSGDTFLGGEDFDQRLIDFMADRFKEDNDIDLRADSMALQRLKEGAERAKHELSSSIETEVNLPFIAADSTGPKHLIMTIERQELEDLVIDLVERTFKPCVQAIKDAGITKSEIGEVLLVGGMTRMPMIQKAVEEFFEKVPLRGVNPDEVVAVGAAVQGAVLTGDVNDVLLLDITPLSLGVETGGGVFTNLIERNTTIPTRKKQIFTTSVDSQEFVPIHVLQGERKMAVDNTTLAKFELTGIPPAPRGVPQIQVSFDIDANGIVSVLAKDLGTGKQQVIRVTAGTGLSQRDIDRIIEEAEQQQQNDETRQALAEQKVQAESLIYTSQRAVEEYGEVITETDLNLIKNDIEELKEALNGEDVELIKELRDQLETSAFRIAEAMYADVEIDDDNTLDEDSIINEDEEIG